MLTVLKFIIRTITLLFVLVSIIFLIERIEK